MEHKSFINGYSRFINTYSIPIIIGIVLITVFFAFSLVHLQFDADFEKMIIPQTETGTTQTGKPVTTPSEYPQGFAIMVDSPDLFNPDLLTAISTAMEKLDAYDEVGPNLSPFSFVTIEKRGTRLTTIPMNPHAGSAPWTQEEAALLESRLQNDDIANNYLYTEDGHALLIYYSTKALGANFTQTLAEFKEILHPVEQYATVSLMSSPLIQERVMNYLGRDLGILLAVCFLVILTIYYLEFRAKRAVAIPFSLSVIGIIWTLGTMSLIGYKLTIINVITPCMVLTLGSSYSIHMLSEYFATWKKNDPDSISHAVQHIASTIFVACLTTVFGFLSLMVSDTQAFREFGISVSIGVIYCAVLAIIYLPALLVKTIPPREKSTNHYRTGNLSKLVGKISQIVTTRWPYMLMVFVLIVGGFLFTKDRIILETNYMSYFPKDDPIVKSSLRIAEKMGSTSQYMLTINAPQGEKDYFYQPEILKQVHGFELALLENCPDIVHSLSFPSYIKFMNRIYSGENGIPDTPGLMRLLSRLLTLINNQLNNSSLELLINSEGNQITLALRNYDSVEQDIQTITSSKRVEEAIATYAHLLPEGTTTVAWGSVVDSLNVNKIITDDQAASTLIAFVLILVVALLVFRSVKFSFFSIIPVLVGVMANYIFMYIAGIPFDLVTVGFSSVTVGAGVDDALHFLLRYRKNLTPGITTVKEAVANTMIQTGTPIILSTASVITGLLALTLASYVPIQYFGLLLSIALLNTLAATLFILPAFILLFDYLATRFHRQGSKV